MDFQELIVDQSSWGTLRVTGEDRVRFIQGMVMGDVAALEPGGWVRTAMLSPKGRVMSVFDVVAREDDLLLLCQPGLAQRTAELLSKYAIMDDVEFTPSEMPIHRVWSDPAAVWTAPPLFETPDGEPASAEAVEVRRIEAGLPIFDVDVSEASFPFESPLAEVISYDKGCYIGQEPVHRVHAKGQAQKMLRGLRFESGEPPAVGAAVSHRDRDKAGTISSAAMSPVLGPIALATLHRTAYEPGDTVSCEGREATIAALPFSR